MIKSYDGREIYLDNDFEANGRPGVSWTTNFCWIFLAMCVMGPVQFLVIKQFPDCRILNLGVNWWSFYFMIAISISCVIFMRVGMFKARHPMAYHWLQILGGSFRVFYLGSLLWLSLTEIDWWAYLLVMVLWLFSELTNYYEIRKVSDEEITQAFRKRFKSHPEGYLLYNPIVNVKDLYGRNRAAWIKWRNRFETLGAAIVIIIGPALFIRSQLYRDNFEPRFLIVAGLLLAMALALRHMTTEVAIARRALKLKQLEG